MNLLHYSPKELSGSLLESRQQDQRIAVYEKPKGLWVSVQGEDDWANWCRAESFNLAPLAHRVTLMPEANILIIRSASGLHRFTREYGELQQLPSGMAINWKQVAERFQGIIIAPYQWSCRLDFKTSWYYIWDCASGCIWDVGAIENIVHVPELNEANLERLQRKQEWTFVPEQPEPSR